MNKRLITAISPNNGFTLLEVMVAIAIMAIALVTIIQLFSGSLKVATASFDYTKVTILAQQKMNELLAEKELAGGDSGSFDELLEGETENSGYAFSMLKELRWEYTIDTYTPEVAEEDTPEITEGERPQDVNEEEVTAALYKVVLRVMWNEGRDEKEILFTSLKYQ